jgi:hypothetical protein
MELIYINTAGERLTLKQTRPFFLSKLDGTGTPAKRQHLQSAGIRTVLFYISSTLDMRNITLEGTVIASTVDEAYAHRSGSSASLRPSSRVR